MLRSRPLKRRASLRLARGEKKDELVRWGVRRREGVLLKQYLSVIGMGERTRPAFAILNSLVFPCLCKEGIFLSQRIDEASYPPVAKHMSVVGAKLRQQPSRTVLPVWNEPASAAFLENEAQQIALMVFVQPAAEESYPFGELRGSVGTRDLGPRLFLSAG